MAAFLGVDIGSVSVCLALVDKGGNVLRSTSAAHRGRVRDTLERLIAELGPVLISAVGCAPAAAQFLRGALPVDSQVALVRAAGKLFPGARSLLHVGGEKFTLIRLGARGEYLGSRSNSSCASGTGSFLDQQARRLGFAGVEELDARARASTSEPPRISTRCAVFARTDLVHAQQQGYRLEEICHGLCKGAAQTIADTLLRGEELEEPAAFTGGVSLNQAMQRELEQVLGVTLHTSSCGPALVAIGAAMSAASEGDAYPAFPLETDKVLASPAQRKEYFYAPLAFDDTDEGNPPEVRVHQTGLHSKAHPVEVEIYRAPGPGEAAVFLGVDVGSTSTKAILLTEDGEPVAGFYTRTLGSPLPATQALCEAMEDFAGQNGITLRILGAAATGAGRKFIGAIIHADLVIDEITAHAKAAYSIDPDIDTIIEIGGQDAKFTTMRDGMVTFSHMNTVCAAGTGSFLEEQASRLGCALGDYGRRVRGAAAPLSSDRCAVFMERDINHFLSQGFSTEEILAAALYSVRENYLQKVARGAAMGGKVTFQGATARNKALVAAFREGLGVPVLVSRYCHLTGALGAALLLRESGCARTSFPGLKAMRGDIPVRSETCSLCANACKLRIAAVGGEEVAYGFLCGRDFTVKNFVDRNRSGFDALKERARVFRAVSPVPPPCRKGPVIGIPSALGLTADVPVWEAFFSSFGIRVVTSRGLTDAVELGRETHGGEFCAPLAALRGHVSHLLGKADWVFLPSQFEERSPGSRLPRAYCYYTQFSTALACNTAQERSRCLMPYVSWTMRRQRTVRELHDSLARMGVPGVSRARVSAAFGRACAMRNKAAETLRERFRTETAHLDGPAVVLLGRPYNLLSAEMNKGIPGLFSAHGVKTFLQEMVPWQPEGVKEIAPLLEQVHWHYAAEILTAACVVAQTPKLYPVYLTSFKCAPDSIAVEYFKRIMDTREKPYLVLQLDDHDSTLGYETRIEAGVASFRNHFRQGRTSAGPRSRNAPLRPNPCLARRLDGKTLLFPVWDPIVNPLLAACLRREGVDARVLEEDPLVIRKAMRHNTGQCIPLSVIAEETARYVESHGLDPSRTALWMARSRLSCNIGMFPAFIKSLLEAKGGGMEKVDVFAGSAFYLDFPLRTSIDAYRAYLVGGLLRRAGCHLRPYEIEPGATDRAIGRSMEKLLPAFEGRSSLESAMDAVAGLVSGIRTTGGSRPKVAIFGDLYVRDNDIMNQGLVSCLEGAGAEVITTPYTEYVGIVARSYFRKWRESGEHAAFYGYRALWSIVQALGKSYGERFQAVLGCQPAVPDDDPDRLLQGLGIRTEHAGESFDNLLKVSHLARTHPDLALFVQASPAFCCPSLVTESMARDIERLTGVPVVSVTYDGTGQFQNDAVVPYLASRAVTPRQPPARSA
jgi:predicted CoA-substrate-specific enzyme activase